MAKLRVLRDCIKRWEGSISPDHMSAKRKVSSDFVISGNFDWLPPKTAEIITLLYEATQGPPLPINDPPALNPTGGVIGKPPPPVNSLRYKKDPSRQGSGVFIAHGVPTENYRDIPRGLIIPSEESKGGNHLTFASRLIIYIYWKQVVRAPKQNTIRTPLGICRLPQLSTSRHSVAIEQRATCLT